jgi:predicted ATPase
MARRNKPINAPAPYLRRVWLDPSRIVDRKAYPFCLPFLNDDFELSLDSPITIIVGENGAGKSTLLEGIAVLAGYDEAGGGKGYRPVDHSNALEVMGGTLSGALCADSTIFLRTNRTEQTNPMLFKLSSKRSLSRRRRRLGKQYWTLD